MSGRDTPDMEKARRRAREGETSVLNTRTVCARWYSGTAYAGSQRVPLAHARADGAPTPRRCPMGGAHWGVPIGGCPRCPHFALTMRLHARHEVARGDGGHHQGTDAQTKTPSMRLVVLGCSGGYPAANRGASLVERIEGDDLNVVGLRPRSFCVCSPSTATIRRLGKGRMAGSRCSRRRSALLAVCAAAAAVFIGAGRADAAAPACSFRLSVSALTDQQQAQLALAVRPRRGPCSPPRTLSTVKVWVLPGTAPRAYRHVAVRATQTILSIGPVRSRTRLFVRVAIRARGRWYLLAARVTVRLRPDLVLRRVRIPPQALVGRSFAVTAQAAEPTGGVPATARVVLSSDSGTIVSAPVSVQPAGRVTVSLPVTLSQLGTFALTLRIVGVAPAETDTTNETAEGNVEVTEFALDAAHVLVPNFAGYGVQFNQNLYGALSRAAGVTDQNVADMEQKMVALGPQLVRIFFGAAAFTDPDLMQSFVSTVELAQRTGATLNITWQANALSDTDVGHFAAVLADLVRNHGITNLRWVTLQNEVNATRTTMDQYEHMYRQLDGDLATAGVRGQIRFMGGDLVAATSPLGQAQTDWFQFMASRMADLLDAYSIHVFWNYWQPARLVQRLQEVRAISDALPASAQKPLYVTEYGVRGQRNLNGTPYAEPGVWDDGTPIEQTDVNAFQHAWFDVLAAKLGYAGTIKWDGYFGRYDRGIQDYSLIGPPQQGWPLRPAYQALRLFIGTVRRGWRVVTVDGSSGTKLLAGYRGPGAQTTLIGLDTSGGTLNTISTTQVSYVIGGLPPDTAFRLQLWNQDGSGSLSDLGVLSSDAAGVATLTVPQQAVFALTTLSLR